jgi:hypothetical protein
MLIKTCMSKEEGLQLIESLLGKDLTQGNRILFVTKNTDKKREI